MSMLRREAISLAMMKSDPVSALATEACKHFMTCVMDKSGLLGLGIGMFSERKI